VLLMLGDAKESVGKLLAFVSGEAKEAPVVEAPAEDGKLTAAAVGQKLQAAKKVIIVPGYGMALSQAQEAVAKFAALLENKGAEVKFAIHPVAGRMPGHMSVLLCEADIDYEKLFMMEDINEEFASCDLAVVIGANDVTNPAANTAEGTPIYGMPVLAVEDAPAVVFCNFDTKPGYAGVPNPLYESDKVLLMLGDAKTSVEQLMGFVK
jgi:NAD(P) transhydrogenase subunit beta